jgi:hypothetical protein
MAVQLACARSTSRPEVGIPASHVTLDADEWGLAGTFPDGDGSSY